MCLGLLSSFVYVYVCVGMRAYSYVDTCRFHRSALGVVPQVQFILFCVMVSPEAEVGAGITDKAR